MVNQKVDKLISTYLKIKAALEKKNKKSKEEKEKLDGQMNTIKTALAKIAEDTGQTTLTSKGIGTAFKVKKTFVSVTDWMDVLCFCIAPLFPKATPEQLEKLVEASNLDYLSKGVLKSEVIAHLDQWTKEDSELPDDEHPDRDPLPPGTKYEVERVINIRKA